MRYYSRLTSFVVIREMGKSKRRKGGLFNRGELTGHLGFRLPYVTTHDRDNVTRASNKEVHRGLGWDSNRVFRFGRASERYGSTHSLYLRPRGLGRELRRDYWSVTL